MSPRSVCDRLRDVLEAIDRAIDFASVDRDELRVAAVLYELIVIGEAVGGLPDDVLSSYEDAPKRAIVGMRNLAAHEYHRVDAAFVWGTVDDDLPSLRLAVEQERTRLGC
ncbi:MAG: HepT-like ribonuclease domain-containing protein [Actinomycetota bacterium]